LTLVNYHGRREGKGGSKRGGSERRREGYPREYKLWQNMLKRIRKMGTIAWQSIEKAEDLMIGEDKPKTHRSTRDS